MCEGPVRSHSELLKIRRHRIIIVCFTCLAPAASPIVLADAHSSALLALAPSPIVLADARPSALLARAPSPIVLADAPPSALLARAPYAIVLALTRLPPSCSLLISIDPSIVSV